MLEEALAPLRPSEAQEVVSEAVRRHVIVGLGGPEDFGISGRKDEHRFRIDDYQSS